MKTKITPETIHERDILSFVKEAIDQQINPSVSAPHLAELQTTGYNAFYDARERYTAYGHPMGKCKNNNYIAWANIVTGELDIFVNIEIL